MKLPLLWSLLQNVRPRYFRLWRAMHGYNHPTRWWEPLIIIAGIMFYCSICYLTIISFNPLPFMLFGGTVAGVIPAAGISSLINSVRERGYFDLICLTPQGTIGLHWALAAHFNRTSPLFRAYCQFLMMLQLFFFAYGTVIGAIYGIDSVSALLDSRPIYLENLLLAANSLIVAAFLRADYMYSILTGALIGLLTPTYSTHRVNGSLMAAGVFALLQLVTIILFASVWRNVGFMDSVSSLLWMVIGTVWYVVLREMALSVMWRVATERLNTDDTELRGLSG